MDRQIIVAIGIGLLGLALIGWFIARRERKPAAAKRRGSGSGALLIIGLAFAAVFDPKARIAVEEIDSQRQKRKTEAGRENE